MSDTGSGDNGSGDNGSGHEDALKARLEKLNAALRARDEERAARDAPPPEKPGGLGRALSVGLNVFSEFAGAVVVGGFIGWQLDAYLGSKPWAMIVFLGLGIAAGFYNVYRVASKRQTGGEE